MKKILYNISLVGIFLMLLSSCDLDLQTDYDYKSSVDDPHISMTAWEYVSAQEDFSMLKEALEYTEVDQYYKQTAHKYTFLLLNNKAMEKYMNEKFSEAETIQDCDREALKNMLLYHIIDGEYSSYGQLDVSPRFVITLCEGESGLLTICVVKNPWQSAVGKIRVNQTGSNSNSPQRQSITSNIMPVNGVMHIFDNYCQYKK